MSSTTKACVGSELWDCLGDASAEPGALTLARFYRLQDTGQLDGSSTNSIIANVVSYGFARATLQCQQSFVNQQTQSVQCNNPILGDLVRNNTNCLQCLARAQQVYDDRIALEQEAAARNPAYVPQTLDAGVKQSYFGLSPDRRDGVCKYVCEQCVTDNVSQNIQMHITAKCNVNPDFLTAFVNGMSAQAKNEIEQRKAGLVKLGANIANSGDVDRLSIDIANSLRTMLSVTQINSLNQRALNVQNVTIEPGSTSVAIQNAEQAISSTMFSSIVSTTMTDARVKNAINNDLLQSQITAEAKFADLVSSLKSTVSTMQDLLTNTIGKIMISILALLFTIALIFASLFFLRPSFLFGGTVEDDSNPIST